MKHQFSEDLKKFLLTEIENLKKSGFIFEEYTQWKKTEIEKITKRKETIPNENILKEKYEQFLIIRFFNLRNKIPNQNKRKIYESSKLQCPPEHQKGYEQLKVKIENGESLFPHLSRKIFNPSFQDNLLFGFGITHLHLGLEKDSKQPLLIKGTKEIVYCILDADDAYIIAIDDHGRWADLDLLKEMKNSFPERMEKHKQKGTLGTEYDVSEQELLNLWKNGINITTLKIDGEYYDPPGFGVTTSGISISSTTSFDKSQSFYHNLGEKLISFLENNPEILSSYNKSIPKTVSLVNPYLLKVKFEGIDKTFTIELNEKKEIIGIK